MRVTSKLIEKYHRGHCTPDEIAAVEQWLKSESEEEKLLTAKELDEMSYNTWKGIAPQLDSSTSSQMTVFKQVMRYAAAAIVLFALGFSIYYFSGTPFANKETQVAITYKTVQTQRGEKRTVTLSDGSTIRMNYETEIRVPAKFEGNERVVYLKGHAYFDVVRNPDKPFIIYTEDSKTQVLGTSFDIDAKEKGTTQIIVTSGKVAFSEKKKENNLVTLTENDRAVLGPDNTINTSEVDAARLTAWRENKLIFDGETLEEIIKVLEPWYDVTIKVKDPDLLSKDFILSRDNPTLTEVMDRLSFIGGFEYTIKGQNVTIF